MLNVESLTDNNTRNINMLCYVMLRMLCHVKKALIFCERFKLIFSITSGIAYKFISICLLVFEISIADHDGSISCAKVN